MHELEADKVSLQAERMARQAELRRRDLQLLRAERQRRLCEDIISTQRRIIEGTTSLPFSVVNLVKITFSLIERWTRGGLRRAEGSLFDLSAGDSRQHIH